MCQVTIQLFSTKWFIPASSQDWFRAVSLFYKSGKCSNSIEALKAYMHVIVQRSS